MDIVSVNSWDRSKRQMATQGESLDFADFIPKRTPDERNFALAPIIASSYNFILDSNGNQILPWKTNINDRLSMSIYDDHSAIGEPGFHLEGWVVGEKTDLKAQQTYYRALARETNTFQVPPQPGNPAQDVLLALSKYDSNVDELKVACRLPDSRFPLNYGDILIFLPHLGALDTCSQMLNLRAVAELQNGQNQQALEDIETSFRLIESIRTEPFLISGSVRAQMLTETIQPIWEGLNGHEWSTLQLDRLKKDLQGFDFVSDYKFNTRGERAHNLREIESIRHVRRLAPYLIHAEIGADGQPELSYSNEVLKTARSIIYHSIPDSVFYQNEINLANIYQNWILPIVDPQKQTISPDAENAAAIEIRKEYGHFSSDKIFIRYFLPGVPNVTIHEAFAQDAVNMARIACALEQYRIESKNYPTKLDSLVPRFLNAVPHDVIDGHPFKYYPTNEDRFILYSVGWNKTNEGGRAALYSYRDNNDIWDGDWIWNGVGTTNEMPHP
jgi:hypothetical protein